MHSHGNHKRATRTLTAILALAAPCLAAAPLELGEANPFGAITGNKFLGTWYLATRIGSPTIMTLSRDGAMLITDGLGFGGASGPLPPAEGDRFEEPASPVQGIWARINSNQFVGVGLRMKADHDGKVLYVVRLRYECGYAGNYDTLDCVFTREPFPCERIDLEPAPGVVLGDIPVCPNPTFEPLGSGLPPHTMSGSRLKLD